VTARGGWQVLLGGSGAEGMDRRLIRRFVELAGGPEEARIIVVPTASEQRNATIERYVNAFELEDAQHIEVLDIRTHGQANQAETLRALDGCSGLMFTGGDQMRLLSILGGTRFVDALRGGGREGLVVGGSSAGAMALGDPVIVRGEPTAFYQEGVVKHMPGLGLLEGVTVDTHLVARGRLTRLISIVSARPDALGLGLEEGCGVAISPEGLATVIGDGVVCVVDAAAAEPADEGARRRRVLSVSGLKLHVLADGDVFDLRARRVASG
jgi:cyanophycinase